MTSSHRRGPQRSKEPDPEASIESPRTATPGGARKPVAHPIAIPENKLDFDTLKILWRFKRFGHEAYLVGGCVRDLLLDRVPKDFDVATSARPRQIKRLFRNCRIIGRRFKLAHIHFGEKIIEVSTFRKNPQDINGNHDDEEMDEDLLILRDNVYGTAEEDALRRDFTINALFYDVEDQVVLDYVGGMKDMKRRCLTTIGTPVIRFREDPVRILRAAEFSARLGFRIEADVAEAMEVCGPEITRAARPRVLEEMLQALSCGRARQVIQTLSDLHVLDYVVPEVSDMEEIDRFLRDLEVMDGEDRGRRRFTDALLLTVLFLSRIREEEVLYEEDLEGAPLNPLEPVEKIFDPFVERMGVSRKNAQRIREIFLGLRKIESRGPGRRFKPSVLVRRAHFPETLAAYKVICLSENASLETHNLWLERYTQARSGSKNSGSAARKARKKRSRPRKH